MKHIFSKQNRALLSELVRTDFKLRYQGSVLGYAWTLLRPLLLFVILYVVFFKFLRFGSDVPNYPVYLLLGIVMWSFFTEMTSQSLTSIVARGDLIRKIRIPRWIIVISSSISALINVCLNLVVVVVFLFISGVGLSYKSLLFGPILLELYLLSLGVSLILSALYVKYRDMNYVWEIVLQAGFYVTPILYSVSRIGNDQIEKIILMNPVAQTIQDARYVVVTTESQTVWSTFNGGWYAFIPILFTLIVLVIGVTYFRSRSKFFAEDI